MGEGGVCGSCVIPRYLASHLLPRQLASFHEPLGRPQTAPDKPTLGPDTSVVLGVQCCYVKPDGCKCKLP